MVTQTSILSEPQKRATEATAAPKADTSSASANEGPKSAMQNLKDRIQVHYDLSSDYYLRLWGDHIHHGYWPDAESRRKDNKATAQTNLVQLLAKTACIKRRAQVLDVGCGIGGTARHLATELGCVVTGITNSGRQVEIARKLALEFAAKEREKNKNTSHIESQTQGENTSDNQTEGPQNENTDKNQTQGGFQSQPLSEIQSQDPTPIEDAEGFIPMGAGKVRFIMLDADRMGDYFAPGQFDTVWISESLNHFDDKSLFFRNSAKVLRDGGMLGLADWAKAEDLSEERFEEYIKPIEEGQLLPPLCTVSEYQAAALDAGLVQFEGPNDITTGVQRTWELTWELVSKLWFWALAITQGRASIKLAQAFRAMKRGYASGATQYIVVSWIKLDRPDVGAPDE